MKYGPLYQMIMGQQVQFQQPNTQPIPQITGNPMQKMSYVMQAMRNPAAFVKQFFPDIPDQISNDPNQILSYIQQTRGVSNQQIQQLQQMIPMNK